MFCEEGRTDLSCVPVVYSALNVCDLCSRVTNLKMLSGGGPVKSGSTGNHGPGSG